MDAEGHKQSEPDQWSKERQYFDAQASNAGEFNLAMVSRRYTASLGAPLYPLEVAYSLLGDIRGKRVLDVGCGLGENSLLFAHWGAKVTGIDISSGSVEIANQRATELGLNSQVEFIAQPFEDAVADAGKYDIVWSAAFLHHVIDRLPDVVEKLASTLAPGGFVLFSEPVRFAPALQKIRAMIPPFPEGTDDERPLEPAEIAIINQRFVINQRKVFGPISRIAGRYVLSGNYETASATSRTLSDTLVRADRALMSLRGFDSLAMIMVARLVPR